MEKSQPSDSQDLADKPIIKALQRIKELEAEIEKLTDDLFIF